MKRDILLFFSIHLRHSLKNSRLPSSPILASTACVTVSSVSPHWQLTSVISSSSSWFLMSHTSLISSCLSWAHSRSTTSLVSDSTWKISRGRFVDNIFCRWPECGLSSLWTLWPSWWSPPAGPGPLYPGPGWGGGWCRLVTRPQPQSGAGAECHCSGHPGKSGPCHRWRRGPRDTDWSQRAHRVRGDESRPFHSSPAPLLSLESCCGQAEWCGHVSQFEWSQTRSRPRSCGAQTAKKTIND